MNRRTELRIVRPLVPDAPREEIDDSIAQLVADRRATRRSELPDRAPLDYVDSDPRARPVAAPLLSGLEWLVLALITAGGIFGVWIGWPS